MAFAAVAFVVWLGLSGGFQFYYDEWDLVLHQPSSPGGYFASHNGHWSTVPILVYQVLLGTFGMGTHLPFMAVVLGVHIAISLMLFRLVRRRSGDAPALTAAVILLVLGTGSDDFLWAFQVGFDASLLFGLIAMDLLDGREFGRISTVAAASCLVIAVASSGIGVAIVAATAIEQLWKRKQMKRVAVVLPAVIAFLAWYAVVGRAALGMPGRLLAGAAVPQLFGYVATGLGAGAAGVLGMPDWLAPAASALFVGALVLGLRRGEGARTFGALTGLATLFVTAGFERAQLGTSQAASSRYVYVAAVFLLLLATSAVASVRQRPAPLVALACVCAVAVAGNLVAARSHVAYFAQASSTENVELEVLNDLRGAPAIDLRASPDAQTMPQLTAGSFFSAEDRLGSPVPTVDLVSLRQSQPELVDGVLRSVFQTSLHLVRRGEGAAAASPGCVALPIREFGVPAGDELVVTVIQPAVLQVDLGWARPPEPAASLVVDPGMYLLSLPATPPSGFVWRMSLSAHPAGAVTRC